MTSFSLRVLAYHRVGEPGAVPGSSPSLFSATPADFELHVRHLAARYRVVSLVEVLDAQRCMRPLPPRAVLLTFDDGYRDFGEVAWPILRRHGMPATVFVPTSYPAGPGGMFWWDRVHYAITRSTRQAFQLWPFGAFGLETPAARAAAVRAVQGVLKSIPHDQAMALVERLCAELNDGPHDGELQRSAVLNWSELRELVKEGVSVAAHTRSHAALTQLDAAAVRAEVRGSLEDVKRELGDVLPVFCYPFGLHDDVAVEAVMDHGVELAFTCLEGHNRVPGSDPLRLRRTAITRRTSPAIFALRLLPAVSYADRWRHRHQEPAPSARNVGRSPAARQPRARSALKLGYIMSRFPKLSETFVLNEILTVEALGVDVEVFPLLRERQPVAHPEVDQLVRRAHFHPFVSLPILRAHGHFIRRRPGAYFRAFFEVLSKTVGSANFFVGALAIFPKAVRIAYEMRELGVTHVHAHFATHPTVAALLVHRLTGIPFSFVAHGSDLHVDRRMLDAKVEASAFTVTVSNFNKEIIVRTCGEHTRAKVEVIHCGVDPSFFAPRRARGAGHDGFEIVCVASLEEVKGHRHLVEACALLQARGVAFRCHLVGDGPLRREIESHIARAGLAGRVLLYGARPRAEVAALLSWADVAVLASHPTRGGKREGIPVALVEAMAAGLPVVASDLTGIPELVDRGTTGFLVPCGDTTALADALQTLGADAQLRERMGRAGRQKVLREFDLETNTRRLLELVSDGRSPHSLTPPALVAAPAASGF